MGEGFLLHKLLVSVHYGRNMESLFEYSIACGNYYSPISFARWEYGFRFSSKKAAWAKSLFSVLSDSDVYWWRVSTHLFTLLGSRFVKYLAGIYNTLCVWVLEFVGYDDYISWITGISN